MKYKINGEMISNYATFMNSKKEVENFIIKVGESNGYITAALNHNIDASQTAVVRGGLGKIYRDLDSDGKTAIPYKVYSLPGNSGSSNNPNP